MNRSELLFLYDLNDANPNGDPLDENKPRIDEETEINIVTDVRLKRTIRDYIDEKYDDDIFVKEKASDKGEGIQDAKARANDYLPDDDYKNIDEAKKALNNEILNSCIDVRLFGATIPLEVNIKGKKKEQKSSLVYTGPVQFRMGRSLNKVDLKHVKGTGAFASTDGKTQKTFREEYIVPYSLIAFYGVVNEVAADDTKLTDEDVNKLLDGMWNGTKNLITRSKFGQIPRLLLQIEYSEEYYFIGDLNNKISIEHELSSDKEIRKISDVKLDVTNLLYHIDKSKDKIAKISYLIDDDLTIAGEESLISKIESLGIKCEEIKL